MKINLLEAASTVAFDLLVENDELRAMIRRGASQADCLAFINENW